jgi:hypothetical protein
VAGGAVRAVEVWGSQVVPSLKSLARAIYAATKLVGERDGAVVLAAPNEAHRARCQQHVKDVEAAIKAVVGSDVAVVLVIDGAAAAHDDGRDESDAPTRPAAPPPPPDDEVDLSDLVDVPPESVQSPTDVLLDAFPGSQLIEE